jgi:DNA polymerase eta
MSVIKPLYVQNVSDREENLKTWLCRADADYQDKLLPCGDIIVAQLRENVLKETNLHVTI